MNNQPQFSFSNPNQNTNQLSNGHHLKIDTQITPQPTTTNVNRNNGLINTIQNPNSRVFQKVGESKNRQSDDVTVCIIPQKSHWSL